MMGHRESGLLALSWACVDPGSCRLPERLPIQSLGDVPVLREIPIQAALHRMRNGLAPNVVCFVSFYDTQY
jgi:hypothetical protein